MIRQQIGEHNEHTHAAHIEPSSRWLREHRKWLKQRQEREDTDSEQNDENGGTLLLKIAEVQR